MMSSSEESVKEEVDVIYENVSIASTIDPPMEEWSSLLFVDHGRNMKQRLYEEGLYDPGSGDLCNKYLPLSDSSILRHPYFPFLSVKDPGIETALLKPEPKVKYDDDGRDRYFAICKHMKQCPVGLFHKSLRNDKIDLKYYGIHPLGVRPMAMALEYNKFVKVLDLTDNFLNEDACFHLGDMLSRNSTLEELNLSGCRIGAGGSLRLFHGLQANRRLRRLNLHMNQLGDAGAAHFADAVENRLSLPEIVLSYNNLTSAFAGKLAEAMEFNNILTHIDLSWNNFYTPFGLVQFLNRLEENVKLVYLNMSWNSLSGRVAPSISKAMLAKNLQHLDISNNKFSGDAIDIILENLKKAKKLHTFNISSNPLEPADALKVISKMRLNAVKVQNLYMDNIVVNEECMEYVERIKNMKSKTNVVITHGEVYQSFKGRGLDIRELLLNRADFLGNKPKKNKVDIALVILQLVKDKNEIMEGRMFADAVRQFAPSINTELLEEFVYAFPGPKLRKAKSVDLNKVADYISRMWPDRKLPPTPPPVPEDVAPVVMIKEKGKGKGKKK